MAFIPNDYPANCDKELKKICERAVERIKTENSIDLRYDTVAYTATDVVLQEIAAFLKLHPEAVIEISSLLKFRTEKSESENGEKGGNIVPVVEIGEKFKLGVKNDSETEEDDE